jgi:linoleate 10R-lipoxygenase
MLTKLLYRTLPHCYEFNSVYARFPFLVPDKNTMTAFNPNLKEGYIWTGPNLNISSDLTVVQTPREVANVLGSTDVYLSGSGDRLEQVVPRTTVQVTPSVLLVMIAFFDQGYWSAFQSFHDIFKMLIKDEAKKPSDYFRQTTRDLLKLRAITRVSSSRKYIDIVKDVINILPILWTKQQVRFLNESRTLSY